MLQFILDILLLAVFALTIIVCAQRGFVRTVLSMLSVLLALALAVALSRASAPILYDAFVEQPATQLVEKQIDETIDIDGTKQQAIAVIEDLPLGLRELAAAIGVDFDALMREINEKNVASSNIAHRLTEGIVKPIALPILQTLSFFAYYIVLSLLLRLAIRLLDKFTRLPVLKSANKLLGGLLGAVKGILYLILICTVLRLLASFAAESTLAQAVTDSTVVRLLDVSQLIGGISK